MIKELASPTIFCDIDATLLFYDGSIASIYDGQEALPGTLEKLEEWSKRGCRLILTTARRESMRAITEEALRKNRITYDQLIMSLGTGKRVVINDMNSAGDLRAEAFNLQRNQGISEIVI